MTGPARRLLGPRYLKAGRFGVGAPWVERSNGMRSAALVRSVELLRMTGTSSTALIPSRCSGSATSSLKLEYCGHILSSFRGSWKSSSAAKCAGCIGTRAWSAFNTNTPDCAGIDPRSRSDPVSLVQPV